MLKSLEVSSRFIGLDDIFKYFEDEFQLTIDDETRHKIKQNRTFLESSINTDDKRVYGVNTGFGSLCNTVIEKDEIEQLQYNLIVSHACGQGDHIPYEISKLILLLKLKNLSFAKSGVRMQLVEKLCEFYNNGIVPVIYEQGSLGASGDLAPLAHMSLPLLGLGEVWHNGQPVPSEQLLKEKNIDIISLSAKEGLALINGTQFSLAYSIWACYHANRLMRWANLIAAMSLEAFHCSLDPFDEELNALRNQEGQIAVAAEIREICTGSEILSKQYDTVQDPYSFRCVPQVHGASHDALKHVKAVVERELNAVTDNPNILDSSNKILSGGNFHAQPLALSLDYLSIAIAELGSISERRIFKLVDGQRGLKDYLTPKPGLNSGFMIPQYTAASIVSQNKQLCSPASVDSISSSKGQEDHVSMAANAATKTYRVVNNVYKVLATELMVSAQALESRRPAASSPLIDKVLKAYREKVKALLDDRLMYKDVNASIDFIKTQVF